MNRLLERYLGRSAMLYGPNDDGGAGDPPAAAVTDPPAGDPPAGDPPAAAPPAEPSTLLGRAAAAAKKPAGDPPAAVDDKPAAEYVADPNKSDDENAAAKAEHDAKALADKEAADDKSKTKDDPKAVDPASYEITPPEGFVLDPSIEKPFRDFAAKHNLTQDEVKELGDMQIKLYEKQAETHANQVKEWGEAVKTDKELGGPSSDAKMGKAAAFINEFFEPDVAAILDKSGLGNHPGMVRGFYRAGLAMGEIPTFRQNAGAQGKESIVDILYPKD